MVLIAPSILSADFAKLGDEVAALAAAGADWVHVDVMDGRFVPNITIGPPVVAALDKVTDLPLDVHLMIAEPERYLSTFAKAGADYLTVHAEASLHLHRTMQEIRGLGVKAGVSINPATPVCAIEHVLELADLVLVMSVNPGFGGQQFIPSSLGKIEALARLKAEKGYSYVIEVDGGINAATAEMTAKAGAGALVAGNYVFSEKPYEKPIARLKEAVKSAKL